LDRDRTRYDRNSRAVRAHVLSGGAAPVIDREQADGLSVGAAWLWCVAGCLISWSAVAWVALELTIR